MLDDSAGVYSYIKKEDFYKLTLLASIQTASSNQILKKQMRYVVETSKFLKNNNNKKNALSRSSDFQTIFKSKAFLPPGANIWLSRGNKCCHPEITGKLSCHMITAFVFSG